MCDALEHVWSDNIRPTRWLECNFGAGCSCSADWLAASCSANSSLWFPSFLPLFCPLSICSSSQSCERVTVGKLIFDWVCYFGCCLWNAYRRNAICALYIDHLSRFLHALSTVFYDLLENASIYGKVRSFHRLSLPQWPNLEFSQCRLTMSFGLRKKLMVIML